MPFPVKKPFLWSTLVSLGWSCLLVSPLPAEPKTVSPGWFEDVSTIRALDFTHIYGSGDNYFMPEILGGGGALFDYDNDGDLDIYLVNGHDRQGGSGKTRPQVNRLFRQEKNGRFSDATAATGLGDPGYGMGTALGDMDNDGDLDLYVTNYGTDTLYRNDGGKFTNITIPAGLGEAELWSTSAAFLDYDRDGWLDLYVAHYLDYDPASPCSGAMGKPDYCGPRAFPGVPDRLYRNLGNGRFVDVSETSGIARTAGKGLGVYPGDFNGDGHVDIYVANDGEANNLWIWNGTAFEDQALLMGVAVNMMGQPEASMGVAAGDVDGDGDLDLFMTHLGRETNTLYINQDNLGFEDRSHDSAIGKSSLPYTGFGTGFLDFDHDGDLDASVVNGRVSLQLGSLTNSQGAEGPLAAYAEPNQVLENDGKGRFTPLGGRKVAEVTGKIEVSRGLILGDMNADGDLDILVTNIGGPARLYDNQVPKQGNWLQLRAIDPSLKRDAVGAQVQLRACERTVTRYLSHSYGYLTSAEATAHFGLGECSRVEGYEVRWPDGPSERFPGTGVDRSIVLYRGKGKPSIQASEAQQ